MSSVTTMSPEGIRETALLNFYSAERRAGACPLVANERMHEYAKRLDALYEGKLETLRNVLERA